MRCSTCGFENDASARHCRQCAAALLPVAADTDHPTGVFPPHPPPLTPGVVFAGRYAITEKLGEGGMGAVYRAIDQEVQEDVALKILTPWISADLRSIERFRNELRLARHISHTHVCRVYHLGQQDDRYYIVMEYVQGETLKALQDMTGRLEAAHAVAIARQMAEGLAEAHRCGVVHRDLKPQNIMVARDGTVKIMDFGIARGDDGRHLTDAGRIVGTPSYMSPEQASGGDLDRRSDIYSFGVILFELVTGELPFVAETPLAAALKQATQTPPDPSTVNAAVPGTLSRIILRCLERDRERRYGDVHDVLTDLVRLEPGGAAAGAASLPARAAPHQGRPRRRAPWPMLALALVLTVAAALVLRSSIGRRVLEGSPDDSKPSLVIIPFENLTGDQAYDYLSHAIPNLLITSLEQTGRFHVVTWERMADLRRQLGKPDTASIDAQMGFDLARLDRVGALAIGSVAKAGDVFATDVKLLDVESKGVMVSASARGAGLASILTRQIDELSRDIARGAGRVEPSGGRGAAISDVTTKSLDAYRLFLEGRAAYEKNYFADAKRFLEQAIALDDTFAVAQLYLAWSAYNLDDVGTRNKALENAKLHAARATEKERLLIEAVHAGLIQNDPEKRIRLLEDAAAKYPKEKYIHQYLGQCYRWLGRNDAALAQYTRALALDPSYGEALNGLGYVYASRSDYPRAIATFEKYAAAFPADANPPDSLAEMQLLTGNLEEAVAKYTRALEIKPDFNGANWRLAYVHMLREDYDAASKQLARFLSLAQGSPGEQAQGVFWNAFLAYWRGHAGHARSVLRQLARPALQAEAEWWRSLGSWLEGWIDVEAGDGERAREAFHIWFAGAKKSEPQDVARHSADLSLYLACVDLRQGDRDAAASRLREVAALLETVDDVNRPRIRSAYDQLSAELLLAQHRVTDAIARAREVRPVPLPSLGSQYEYVAQYNAPFPRDTIARAFIEAGQIDQAIGEYKRLLTLDPASAERRLIPRRYHDTLAVLQAHRGRTNEVR